MPAGSQKTGRGGRPPPPAPAPPPNHVGTARGTAARACCACVPWVRQTAFIKMVICTKIAIFTAPTHYNRYHTRQRPRPAAGGGALRVWGVCRGAAVWGANFLLSPRVFWGGAKYRPHTAHTGSPQAPHDAPPQRGPVAGGRGGYVTDFQAETLRAYTDVGS